MTAPTAPASLRDDVAFREVANFADTAASEIAAKVTAAFWMSREHEDGDSWRHGRIQKIAAPVVQHALAARVAERDTLIATLRAERDEAAADRDALLAATGFKPGPLEGDLRREVILDDVGGLRDAMVKARREAARVQSDAELWTMRMLEKWPGDTLLLRLWRQRREATKQARAAEAALAAAEADLDHAIAMAREPIGDTWDEIRRLEGECRAMAAEVREYRDALKHHCDAHDATKAALAAAQDRIAEMERALVPFAEAAEAYVHSHSKVAINERPSWAGKDYWPTEIRVGHLRAARSTLHPEEMHDER